MRHWMKVVCPSPAGWSKVPNIILSPGVYPVMRFAFLIPAIMALGIAGCQVPPPATTAPVSAPTATTTPAAGNASEVAADAVMETGAQTDIDDTTTADPDVTTADRDDVLSTTRDTESETKTDEHAAEMPATGTASTPVDVPVDAPADASESAPEDKPADVDRTNAADDTPDIVPTDILPADPTPRVTTEPGVVRF